MVEGVSFLCTGHVGGQVGGPVDGQVGDRIYGGQVKGSGGWNR